MNDAEFEKNLRELLRPAKPSANLHARLRQELATAGLPPATRAAGHPTSPRPQPGFFYRLLRDFGWACAGAAAVLAVLAILHGKPAFLPKISVAAKAPAQAAPDTAAFEHDETTHELVSTENSDQLIETDDGPAREVRYSYVERHAWSNPQTGARVVLEVPREDVYLVPVSLQ